MKMSKFALVLIIVAAIPAAVQAADIGENDKPVVSVTPYVGGGLWSDDLGLDNSFMYGGRLALHLKRWLGVEGSYGRSGAQTTVGGLDVDVDHYGADLFVDLRPSARFNPYLTGGWGQLDYTADGGDKMPLNGWEAGAGLKIRLGGDDATHRNLRLEVRNVMTDLNDGFANDGDLTHNLLVTAGLQFAFGKSHRDSDGDGVEDGRDACDETPAGALVGANGCPLDSDNDGVFDGLDECQGTPAGATVTSRGCPTDSDKDGVFDGLDKCPATPAGAKIDARGCPLDSDNDGVFDGLDKCPDTDAKLQVDASGCPIAVTESEIQLLDTGSITTTAVVFKTASAELDRRYTATLDEIGETLVRWPTLRLEIGGHTDSTGSAAFNETLSADRASSVLNYLTRSFPMIKAAQFTTVGYGANRPVADNSTVEGRAANRRVEFKVLNTEELKTEIQKRKMLER